MLSSLKKINYFECSVIFVLTIFAGFMISFYNLSVLFAIASILFVIISFKYFNKILFLLILYIPFQVALNIAPGIDLASGRVFIVYLFIIWIIKSLVEKRFIIRLNLQTLLILTFLFFAIFSIFQAWDIERALRKIFVFLSIFPIYFIITSLRINKNRIYKIINIIFISGFILSLIGIAQFMLQFFVGINPIMEFWSKYVSIIFYGETFGAQVISNPSWLVNIAGATVLRAFSLFPDPHMFSFYLGLLIPVALAFVLVCKKNTFLNSKLYYLVLITMLLAEFLTFSRGGYIGMIAGISIVIVLFWKHIDFNKKIILGLGTGFLVLFIMFNNQSIVSRFMSIFDFNEGSNTERIKNWNQGREIFSNNFLFGVGIGNYSLEINPTIEYRAPVYAHNLYLDIGAEMGIIALFAWLLLVGITILQLYKESEKTDDNFFRALFFGLIGSLVWFSAHSFFDTSIYSPTILAIFMVFISISAMTIKANQELEIRNDKHF